MDILRPKMTPGKFARALQSTGEKLKMGTDVLTASACSVCSNPQVQTFARTILTETADSFAKNNGYNNLEEAQQGIIKNIAATASKKANDALPETVQDFVQNPASEKPKGSCTIS